MFVKCHHCGATTSAQKWRGQKWFKVELSYTDGNKWKLYTCVACQAKLGQDEIVSSALDASKPPEAA